MSNDTLTFKINRKDGQWNLWAYRGRVMIYFAQLLSFDACIKQAKQIGSQILEPSNEPPAA